MRMEPKPFHVLTEVRYNRGGSDAAIIVPVRFAYTIHGQTWLILEWKRQTEWLPTPAKWWEHLDGSPLGEFQALNWSGLVRSEHINALMRGEVGQDGSERSSEE